MLFLFLQRKGVVKMVFGIDLGTTNSLIGSGDKMFSGLVSSNVDIKARKQVARDAVSQDIVASYKTDMSIGTDGQEAVLCSSIILKELADEAEKQTGEKVQDVIVSVPAYFSTSQREAVNKAAEMAGLNLKCLINEPTAASLYVCRDMKDLIVVYDLGGGTFDITVIDARLGNYTVIATDGKVLGGDDFDNALVEEVINIKKIPIRYRNNINKRKLKNKVRQAKEQLQLLRDNVFVDLTDFGISTPYELTVERYKEIMHDVFWETIVRTKYVITNNLPASEQPKLIFVGGSTNCPYLREMVTEALELEEVMSDCAPDLTVAKGVALYAEMYEQGIAFDIVDDVTKRLCIEDSMGKTVTVIDGNTILPASGSVIMSNATQDSELRLRLFQGDSAIAANNAYIGTLVYDYHRVMDIESGIVKVTANVSRDGIIKLAAEQLLLGPTSRQEIQLQSR